MTKITMTKKMELANAITHGGVFHADEVLATIILSKVMDKVTVARTFKVPEDIDSETVVYDIGFGELDHHQKGGNGARENGVPYASCGLIWKKFGHKVVEHTCNPDLVWKLVDRDLIQGVDACDNGVMPKAEYPAQALSLSQMISGFNPSWDEQEDSDSAFLRAVAFAETVFDNVLKNAVSKAKAQGIVEEAIENAEGNILVLDQFVPWQEFLFASENKKAEDILFVIFPSMRGGYNWQCVPDCLGGFAQRKPVPAEWKGLRDSELQGVTGVETATFCHPAGFIGGAETLSGAIALAELAVRA